MLDIASKIVYCITLYAKPRRQKERQQTLLLRRAGAHVGGKNVEFAVRDHGVLTGASKPLTQSSLLQSARGALSVYLPVDLVKRRIAVSKWVVYSLLFAFGFAVQSNSANEDTGPIGFPLYGPDNVVVTHAGEIFVADTDHASHHRLLKLSPEGKILAEWHLFARGTHQSNGPEGIALDDADNLYVADQSSNQVLKLSRQGEILLRLGGKRDPGRFDDLGHVAVGPRGHIFVSESKGKIQEFSPTGQFLAAWARTKGDSPDQFSSLESIAISRDGSLYVEDWGNHRILKLSPQGKTLMVIGSKGSRPGQFLNSAGLALDHKGNIYIADLQLRRIQVFSLDGKFISTIGNDSSVSPFRDGPGGVAVDLQSNVYAPDGKSIVKLSPSGQLLARWP